MVWKFFKSEKEAQDYLGELFQARKKDVQKKQRGRTYFKAKKDPQKASDLLNLYFKNEPQAIVKIQESQALSAWPKYVGSEAATVSKAIRLKENELLVWVSDPLWLHQLLLVKRQLVSCYQRDFPQLKIKDIYFKRNVL